MSIKIMLQFNGKNLTLPVNPEELHIPREAENEDIEIAGIGRATRKGEPSLRKITIESFFPSKDSYYYTGVKPKTCVEFINSIWKADNKNNNVGKFVTSGLPKNINMYFVIDNFEPYYKAGEEKDIYYTLSIKEYKPYGVKTVKVNLSGTKQTRAKSTSKKTSSKKTYKVQKGDCLWNITKAACGNGSKWRELYNLNKKVIGANPNLIYPRTNFDFTRRMGCSKISTKINKCIKNLY